MYTNRHGRTVNYTKQQTSEISNFMVGVIILGIAILCNIIVELPLYQHIIVALS